VIRAMVVEEEEGLAGSRGKPDLGAVVVLLLKGVLYRDAEPARWSQLLELQNRVRDFVAVVGLDLILDEAEGYAFLQSREVEEGEESAPDGSGKLPRLVARRQLSFPVSLLLALLRKKLAEFDASGAETRLVLNRDEIVDLIRLFLPDSSNEARLVDQVERHINKVVELGFLRKLKSASPATQPGYEVRRIIKAFVDAQWLAEFDQKLDSYRQLLRREESDD
jgi:hypothetical protein